MAIWMALARDFYWCLRIDLTVWLFSEKKPGLGCQPSSTEYANLNRLSLFSNRAETERQALFVRCSTARHHAALCPSGL
jgi:hypothetical protein